MWHWISPSESEWRLQWFSAPILDFVDTSVCFNGSPFAPSSYGFLDRLFGDDPIQIHGIVAALLAISGVALTRKLAF